MNREKFIRAYLQAKPLPLDDIAAARRLEKKRSLLSSRVAFPGTIDDIKTEIGQQSTAVRIYTPPGRGPFAVILYMHGGGFSIGSPDTSDNLCRALAAAAAAVLISIDYDLAPEHPFPCALEQCDKTALWVVEHDVALNIRSDRLVVAGDSAGANLAAALCLLARQNNEWWPARQVLICPLLDQLTDFNDKLNNIGDRLLTADSLTTFSRYYLTDQAAAADPLASPLLATDLTGLPPATIISAGLDPLAEEAFHYEQRLKNAGVPVSHHHFQGQVHDFPLFIRVLDDAADAVGKIAADLKQIAADSDD